MKNIQLPLDQILVLKEHLEEVIDIEIKIADLASKTSGIMQKYILSTGKAAGDIRYRLIWAMKGQMSLRRTLGIMSSRMTVHDSSSAIMKIVPNASSAEDADVLEALADLQNQVVQKRRAVYMELLLMAAANAPDVPWFKKQFDRLSHTAAAA